jgi:hypothetical protein
VSPVGMRRGAGVRVSGWERNVGWHRRVVEVDWERGIGGSGGGNGPRDSVGRRGMLRVGARCS